MYDVIVVGAGPAGSLTAKTAAEGGLNVLMVERKLDVGVPVQCGEFLPSLKEMRNLAPKARGLEELFNPPQRTIANRTKSVRFVFPNSKAVEVEFEGVVLERKLFDKHLAEEAIRAGAELMVSTRALGLLPGGKGIRVRREGSVLEIPSKVVVGADGPFSLIAREAGLPVSRDPMDYGIGHQYEMVGVEHDPEVVDMYFGRAYAPGTYAWIIPKGKDIANVGTGVRVPYMEKGLSVRDYLDRFIKKHPLASKELEGATPTAIRSGLVPVGGPLKRTYGENLLVVGDAAGHTIPTVGGGVPTAMICGRIAGEMISRHLANGYPLSRYEEEWRRELGETLQNSLRLRRMGDITLRSDRFLNFIVERGWANEENVLKVVRCRMNTSLRVLEGTLIRLANMFL